MDLNDLFSDMATATVSSARKDLVCLKDRFFGSEHVLLAILNRGESRATNVLQQLGVSPNDLRDALLEHVQSFSSYVRRERPFSGPRQLMIYALEEVFGTDTPKVLELAQEGELGVKPEPPRLTWSTFYWDC